MFKHDDPLNLKGYNTIMSKNQLPTRLPESLYRFFWDIDARKLNPAEKPYYVINRLLDKGNLEPAKWVLGNYPKDLIAETFRKMRDFSPWNGRFWTHYLGLSEKEVACLQTFYLNQRKQLWPY